MKFLKLPISGSSTPLYLNVGMISYFALRTPTATAITLDNGREFLTPWSPDQLEARIMELTVPPVPEKPKGPSNTLFGGARTLFSRG